MVTINLLRAFIPQAVVYGTDLDASNGAWKAEGEIEFTYFRSGILDVQVIFSPNPDWKCMEISFKTALRNISCRLDQRIPLFSLLRAPDLAEDANRGTLIFRQVMHVVISRLGDFDRMGFNGAHPQLDRIYGRLGRLDYVRDLFEANGFAIASKGRDIFVERVSSADK